MTLSVFEKKRLHDALDTALDKLAHLKGVRKFEGQLIPSEMTLHFRIVSTGHEEKIAEIKFLP